MSSLPPADWLHHEIKLIEKWFQNQTTADPLIHLLKQIQSRLGTAEERDDDLEEARRLAHLLRNRALNSAIE